MAFSSPFLLLRLSAIVIIYVASSTSSFALPKICNSDINSTQYQATYQITHLQGGKTNQASSLTLSRFNDTIIYQHQKKPTPETVSYESWLKSGEYIRYFPKEKRSVTYQRSDLLALNIHSDLDKQFHLLSEVERQKLTLHKTEKSACFTQQYLQGGDEPTKIDVTWLKEISLPQSITIEQGENGLNYQLIQLSPFKQSQYSQLTSGYRDIDFADVGDNESDPFIAKMITQGFIQHGSSGFYSADGKQIESTHHNHHH